jgi:hypothetical protein
MVTAMRNAPPRRTATTSRMGRGDASSGGLFRGSGGVESAGFLELFIDLRLMLYTRKWAGAPFAAPTRCASRGVDAIGAEGNEAGDSMGGKLR